MAKKNDTPVSPVNDMAEPSGAEPVIDSPLTNPDVAATPEFADPAAESGLSEVELCLTRDHRVHESLCAAGECLARVALSSKLSLGRLADAIYDGWIKPRLVETKEKDGKTLHVNPAPGHFEPMALYLEQPGRGEVGELMAVVSLHRSCNLHFLAGAIIDHLVAPKA